MSNITNLQARAEELAINVWIGTPAQIEERKKDVKARKKTNIKNQTLCHNLKQ